LLAGEEWLHLTTVPIAQMAALNEKVSHLPAVGEVWVSNVAGVEVAQHIRSACESRGWQPEFIVAQKKQCGVRNGYTAAGQLGSDRWAALLAARQRTGKSALVVNCGTATTIDALSDRGEFLGGLILPGIALMQSSIIVTAAQLQQTDGKYADHPLNTADAILSGALQATCGAIQRQFDLLGDAGSTVLLSGGAAQPLRKLLQVPVDYAEDLVLQGLKLIAQEASAS